LILSTLVLFGCAALPADTSPSTPASAALPAKTSAELPATKAPASIKPDVPAPKIAAMTNDELEPASAESLPAASKPLLRAPIQPATPESYETPRKRMIWWGLNAAGHSGAAFDSRTTRRAITDGYGVEADPFQKPFAHSNVIYATTQVSPLLMDYVGHRMMRSRFPLLRRFWWLPQTANASFSWGAAIHNYRVVH